MNDEPTLQELASALKELATFLRERGERWAEPVERSAREVEAGDAHGVRRFLRLFGGMGSINDLVFHPMNNNATADEDVDLVNKHFQSLRSHAWSLATSLLRELDRSA